MPIRLKPATAIALCAMTAIAIAKPIDLQMGSRGFSMGGAFAALADDASSTYWNPAGLARLGSLTLSETNWMLQDVSDVNVNYFAGGIPISDVGTVAGSWLMQYASLEQGEPGTMLHSRSDWYEHHFSLAAARELWEKLWIFEHTGVGFSLNRYVLNSGKLNGAGTGFDLGFQTRFPHGLSLGLVMRSLGADMMGEKVEPEYRAGVGYTWSRADRHRIAVDLDLATKDGVEYSDGEDGVATNYKAFFGGEYLFRQEDWAAALRAGLNNSLINSRDAIAWSLGAGIGYRGFMVDYAFQKHTDVDLSLGQSHRVTIEVRLGEFLAKERKESARELPAQAELSPADAVQKAKVDSIKAKYRKP